jgi:lysyl-tRNA synthetase class 2
MSQRPEQEQVRFEKLKTLRALGYPFPNDVKVTGCAADLLTLEPTEPSSAPRYTLAGRLVQIRQMGKASFVHLLDSSGKIQLYVKKDEIGEESYNLFKDFDMGDIVEATGYLFITKTGEKSLHVEKIRLLVKSLIPLPEKWAGLTDVEARYRYRYVDLISNYETREVFRKRAQVIREVRRFLDDRGFLEVETPVLHYIPGGASAKPFKTHYNSLSCDMYLRIALELPLKKLLVGGFERIYEIGRNFRNEGISRKHNPEFSMLEYYQAYATYEDLMNQTEEMYRTIVQNVCGTLQITYGEHSIDFSGSWPRISMLESVHAVGGVSREFNLDTVEGVQSAARAHKVHLEEPSEWGRSLEALWGELVEHKLINPTFITHHPFSISPLARKNEKDPKITDRFELIIAGMESANAFSELNDAVDQRERFEAQAKRKEDGDEEASDVDEDFLRALEHGMPPAGGLGLGIDRLVMLLTNSQSIRDVLLFPQLKPKEE